MMENVPGTAPRTADWETAPPFISHAATAPPVFRHRISLLPSKLKSWVTNCGWQAAPILLSQYWAMKAMVSLGGVVGVVAWPPMN